MRIDKLQITNLRNLESVEIEPHPGLNFLYGSNGAGKTSVLESIVVLSRGRSFRTKQAAELIGSHGDTFQVFALTHGVDGKKARIGIERSGKHWKARRDGKDLAQLSQLTRVLPLVLMEPNSHLLVSGKPEIRRKYIDWGMFHVEHAFLQTWRRFSKILKQRNAALRFRQEELLDSIDSVFIESAENLDRLRQGHSKDIAAKVQHLLDDLSSGLKEVRIDYKKGWSKGSLAECLLNNREKELQKGITSSGPHRSDLALYYGDNAARAVFSRGEQKILAAALLLSQAEILAEKDREPILLLDDLASEFDDEHYNRVLERALQLGGQVWVSGTRKLDSDHDHKMFHVKHGGVQEMV